MNTKNYRPSDYDQVLLSLYAAVSEPEHFWTALGSLEQYEFEGDDGVEGAALLQHANRLHALLENMIKLSQQGGDSDLQRSIRFDRKGRIAHLGRELSQLLGVENSPEIWDLPLLHDDHDRLRRYLKSGSSHSFVLILPSINDAGSRLAEVVSDGGDIHILKLVGLSLSPQAKTVFEESFGVSHAQFRVLECLVAGSSVAAIAKTLDRSTETVRSHIKALSQKLGVRSQSELVSRALSVPVSNENTLMRHVDGGDSVTLEVDGIHIEYASSGDPAGRPVLFFQHATEGPFVTATLRRALSGAGIRLISIARPGAGSTDRKAMDGGDYLNVTARLHHKVVDHLGLASDTLLSVGTGLPHALAYAERFSPKAQILALNPFPPFLTKEDCRSLPGRWSTYALAASRTPFIVQTLVLLAWRLFKNDPDRHVRKMVVDDIPGTIDAALRADIINTLKKNMAVNAKHHAKHYVDEAKILSRNWAASAQMFSPNVRLHLLQGRGHFSIPQPVLARLAQALPNATTEIENREIDPIHLLDAEGLVQRLDRLTRPVSVEVA